MAAFMGVVKGERGEASRLGHRGMETTCASWDGAIQTTLSKRDGVTWATIQLTPWQGHGARRDLYSGPLEKLANMGCVQTTWEG